MTTRDSSLDALLAKLESRTPDLVALRLLDQDGFVRHSSPSVLEPISLADRDYFLQLRQGAASIVSRPISGRVTGMPIMVFARRLVDGKGSFSGAVLGVVDLRHIAELVSDPDMGPHGAIALLVQAGADAKHQQPGQLAPP